jgi:predicted metalloprotease with PDZ domain
MDSRRTWPDGSHHRSGRLENERRRHPVEWQRDAEDMFAFHLEVPAGADAVDVALDFLLPPNSGEFSSGGSSTAKLLDLNWNQVLLYPQGQQTVRTAIQGIIAFARRLEIRHGPRVRLAKEGDYLQFAPVSLETLVDSPVIAGAYFRSIDLSPKASPPHELDMVADSAAALEIKPEDSRHFAHLVTETGALFGARHYRSYHFLLTLSDHVAHFGLEHHESSDNREGEKYLTDEDELMRGAYLLCHEMVHSWNGKYRRPAGLATPDFQQPMKGELLWVYEGLTDYLGIVLAARSGLWTNESFREYIALEAAGWTAAGPQLAVPGRYNGRGAVALRRAGGRASWRRSTDFYEEGDLIWLEADVLIRQQTQGKPFAGRFLPEISRRQKRPAPSGSLHPEDVVAALNEIAPYDWGAFFQKRVYATNPRAPLGGIEAGGWRLTYTNAVPALLKARESGRKYTDMRMSLGLIVKEDGYIQDVIPGSPADKAGVGTGDESWWRSTNGVGHPSFCAPP